MVWHVKPEKLPEFRELVDSMNYDRATLAKEIGLSRSSLTRILSGHNNRDQHARKCLISLIAFYEENGYPKEIERDKKKFEEEKLKKEKPEKETDTQRSLRRRYTTVGALPADVLISEEAERRKVGHYSFVSHYIKLIHLRDRLSGVPAYYRSLTSEYENGQSYSYKGGVYDEWLYIFTNCVPFPEEAPKPEEIFPDYEEWTQPDELEILRPNNILFRSPENRSNDMVQTAYSAYNMINRNQELVIQINLDYPFSVLDIVVDWRSAGLATRELMLEKPHGFLRRFAGKKNEQLLPLAQLGHQQGTFGVDLSRLLQTVKSNPDFLHGDFDIGNYPSFWEDRVEVHLPINWEALNRLHKSIDVIET